jgi:hypothetical protein
MNNKMFDGRTKVESGLKWFEFGRLTPSKLRTPLTITFAFVATHNHFVLDRGGKVFNRSAPVIKLSIRATDEEHLRLLSALNSSTASLWMKQQFHDKGNGGYGGGIANEEWERFYEFDGTKLQQFPLPTPPLSTDEARELDSLSSRVLQLSPATICGLDLPSRASLESARRETLRLLAEMVALQEELDWECLYRYGVTDERLTVPEGEKAPRLMLGERAFEVVLARRMAAGALETTWFERHRSRPITELPSHWPDWYRELVDRRIALIEKDRDVGLVERPEHKRRWLREPWEAAEERALRSWLLDRLENRVLWFEGAGESERAVCRTVAQLGSRMTSDDDFMSVARLWKRAIEIDATSVIGELVADEHVPAQSAARYKASGRAKRRQWQRTWELQRVEDDGVPLPDGLPRIPVPPKYAQADFHKTSYWQARGKLDVPKERFVSIAAAERESDPSLVLAWSGFDHEQLAQAIATLIHDRQAVDGWDGAQCWPLVVALGEQMFWLELWHNEIDQRWGQSPAVLYRGIAEQAALAAGYSLAEIDTWEPRPTRRSRKANR